MLVRPTVQLVACVFIFVAASARAETPAGGLPEVRRARQAIAKAAAVLVKDLGDCHFATRQAAQAALTELGKAVVTETLVRFDPADLEQATRAERAFDAMEATIRQGRMLLSLSRARREKVLKLASASPKVFGALFDPDPVVAAEAVAVLGQSGKVGAQEVLRWALGHRQAMIRFGALRTVRAQAKADEQMADAIHARMIGIAADVPRLFFCNFLYIRQLSTFWGI